MESLMGIATLIFVLFLYMIPAFVGAHRQHPSRGGIAVLTLLLGWTGIGWILALVWAASGESRRED